MSKFELLIIRWAKERVESFSLYNTKTKVGIEVFNKTLGAKINTVIDNKKHLTEEVTNSFGTLFLRYRRLRNENTSFNFKLK